MRYLSYKRDDPWSRGERLGSKGAKKTRIARFYFRYRATSSGKSMALLQATYDYEGRGQRTLLTKPTVDTKEDTAVVSRLGVPHNVDLLIDEETNLCGLLGSLVAEAGAQGEEPVACLLIDETQFLSPTQVDDLLRIVVKLTVPVIAYGIRTDFLTHSFPGSRRLLEIAHSLEGLKTVHCCGRKTVFNGRTIGGALAFSGEQVAIDGVEVGYKALYPACYFKTEGLLPCEAERCRGGAY